MENRSGALLAHNSSSRSISRGHSTSGINREIIPELSEVKDRSYSQFSGGLPYPAEMEGLGDIGGILGIPEGSALDDKTISLSALLDERRSSSSRTNSSSVINRARSLSDNNAIKSTPSGPDGSTGFRRQRSGLNGTPVAA
jgi:hypothetical protein